MSDSKPVCGIDVAKAKFDVALEHEGRWHQRCFSNDALGFAAFRAWLVEQKSAQAAIGMEATGSYSFALADDLSAAGLAVSVINPARIKAFARAGLVRTKTDQADARLIARYVRLHRPPPESIRTLQAFVHRLEALGGMRRMESNRLETAAPCVHRSLRRMLDQIDDESKQLRHQIQTHFETHQDLKARYLQLQTVPGIGPVTAAHLLAWLPEIRRFVNVKQVVAFVGLSPEERSSGTWKGKTKLSKIGHARLRCALYMPAVSASRMKQGPLKALADRLREKHKPGKVIICALMRKLVHLVYGVLKSGKPYDPNLALAKE